MLTAAQEKSKARLTKTAVWLSVLVCFAIVGAYFLDHFQLFNARVLGVRPRSVEQWWGFLTMPLVHGGPEHLFNNITGLFTCSAVLFYFFPQKGVRIFGWLWLVSGLWTWALAERGLHIGASAHIYALAAFLFLSGVLRKNRRLWALTAFMICFYGGMVWGILPYKPGISWEGHLAGMLAGLVFAIIFRGAPTIMDLYPEFQDPELADDEEDDDESWMEDQMRVMNQQHPRYQIKYQYKPKEENE